MTILWFVSKSGLRFGWCWSGSKLFANVISRQKQLPLARKKVKRNNSDIIWSIVLLIHDITPKVSKEAKINNWYHQVPHLTQDTIWESDKNTIKHHTQESQEVSPGDHKAAMNRQESMRACSKIMKPKRDIGGEKWNCCHRWNCYSKQIGGT